MYRLRAAVPAALVALALAQPARAQSTDPSALVHEGVVLSRDGHNDQALDRFRRAYEIGHGINALGLMGMAEAALGQWLAAERHVREALAHSSDPWVQRRRADLDTTRTEIERHVGTLEVAGEPAGAEVSVNGASVGTLPLAEPVRIEAGSVTLMVRAEGRFPVTRTVDITGGQVSRETVTLRERPTDFSATSAEGAVTPNASTRWHLVVPAVAVAGAGVALEIAGLAVGLGPVQTASTGPDENSFNTLRAVDDVLFAVGAVAIVGGVVWQIVSGTSVRRRSHYSHPAAIGLATDHRGATLCATWRFP